MLTVEYHGLLGLAEAVGREARVSTVVSVVVDADAQTQRQCVVVVVVCILVRVYTIPARLEPNSTTRTRGLGLRPDQTTHTDKVRTCRD